MRAQHIYVQHPIYNEAIILGYILVLPAVIFSATMMVRGYSVKLQVKPLLPQYSCKYTENYHRAKQTQPVLIFIIVIHFFFLFPPQKNMFVGVYKQPDL